MQLDWTTEEEAFRQEVRDFLAQELSDDVKGSMFVNTPARVCTAVMFLTDRTCWYPLPTVLLNCLRSSVRHGSTERSERGQGVYQSGSSGTHG